MHNPILLTAICAVVSFFIGAIPFGLILGRVFNLVLRMFLKPFEVARNLGFTV